MHIAHVVGARPNFEKVAPVLRAFSGWQGCRQTLIHTGQHYDAQMSQVFFAQIGLPSPDVNLEVGSGSHAWQTAEIMVRLEPLVIRARYDLVLVYGDVNSTMAAALVCAKLGIAVGHVEAGLRSFDRSMPEEVNRLITDQLSDLLFTHSLDADRNLAREGIPPEKIFRVGNVMIDTLVRLLPLARQSDIHRRFGLDQNLRATADVPPDSPGSRQTRRSRVPYGVVTLHRPSNVDNPAGLKSLMLALWEIAADVSLIFPVHPRTSQRLQELDLPGRPPRLYLTEPLGYLDFLALEERAVFVITDSGGIQEETTYLGVPCLTMRKNTERPITVTEGTNKLVGGNFDKLPWEAKKVLVGEGKTGHVPVLWDGKAAERIVQIIAARENRAAGGDQSASDDHPRSGRF